MSSCQNSHLSMIRQAVRRNAHTLSSSDKTSSSFLIIVPATSSCRSTSTLSPSCADSIPVGSAIRHARPPRHCSFASKGSETELPLRSVMYPLVVKKRYCKDGSGRASREAVPGKSNVDARVALTNCSEYAIGLDGSMYMWVWTTTRR